MRMQLCLLDRNDNILVNEWPVIRRCVATEGDHGFETLELSAQLSVYAAARLYAYRGHIRAMVLYGGLDVVWDGRVESKAIVSRDLEMTAVGYWAAMGDLPYTALWSTTDVSVWEPITEAQISTVTDTFQSDSNNRLYIAPRKGGMIADGDRGGRYLAVPDQGRREVVAVMFEYEVAGSSLWKASLRRWASSAFGTPTDVWTPTLSVYGTYTGAVCTSFTGSPLLTFEFESEVAQTTLGTAINGVDTTLAPTSLRINTTSGTAVAAPGAVTITPAAMTNITNGTRLLYGSNTTLLEKVTASGVTGTTFNATFKNTHASGVAIKSVDDWAVPEVDTTATAGCAAGAGTVITPASMANITSGMVLMIGWGGEAEEEVAVTAVTSTTFTATLIYGHASGEKIKNGLNTYAVRPQSMTGIVAGMNLEIGGRNGEVINVASVTSTHFTAAFKYGHPGDSPVTTARLQTITPTSMTHIVKGREYRIGNEAGVTNSEPEKITILETTGATFTAEFDNPHGSTDTMVRIYSGDYNAWLKITGLRVATSTTYMVNTTIGSNISAGSQVVTPASMSNIYVGQKLVIDGSGIGDTGEMVTVTAITSTTFTAVFAASHTTSITVKGLVIYADEVTNDVISMHQGEDYPHLSSSTAEVQSPGYDLIDCWYEDEYPSDFLPTLAEKGNGSSPYEIGVRRDRRLYLRPRGALARQWVVDATLGQLRLEASAAAIRNSAYGVFRSADGRVERTATSENSDSITLLGLTRRAPVDADTTSETQAERERDNYLTLYADPEPRSTVDLDRLYTTSRARALLQQLRPGDTLIAGNMPLGMLLQTGGIDPLSWQVLRRVYDLVANRVDIEPRTPARTAQNIITKGVQLSLAAVAAANKPSVAAKGRKLSRRLKPNDLVI